VTGPHVRRHALVLDAVAAGSCWPASRRPAAPRDAVLSRALVRVTGLVEPPESLMTTDIAARATGPGAAMS
jgi:hypothetical protein